MFVNLIAFVIRIFVEIICKSGTTYQILFVLHFCLYIVCCPVIVPSHDLFLNDVFIYNCVQLF